MSEDGKYLFEGKLYELTNNGLLMSQVNLVDKLNSYKDRDDCLSCEK